MFVSNCSLVHSVSTGASLPLIFRIPYKLWELQPFPLTLCKFFSVLSVSWCLLSVLFSLSDLGAPSPCCDPPHISSCLPPIAVSAMDIQLLWIFSCQQQTKHLLVLPEGTLDSSHSMGNRTQRKNMNITCSIQHIPKHTTS